MEMFKVIKEYPLYSVSTEGRVMKNVSRKVMTPSKKPNGYMQINLFTCDGRRKKEYVHRLVALTFIPNVKKLPEVNHIDGRRDNNVLENLEWVTRRENIDKSGSHKPIRVSQKDGELVGEFSSIQDACKRLGLIGSNVSCCLHNGAQKTHRGYVFDFI
ncbi:MAG: HNH endonuclease [Bacteroidaceae bacterium]|nr:HNH endonuclease [Bacteroidaceae bacterium]